MKIENDIGWCDATTNAVTGCDKVSPGCKNCYAQVGTRARILRATGIETWGPKGIRHPVNFEPVFRRLNATPWICDKCKQAFKGNDCHQPCCPDENCTRQLRRIRLFADSNSDWLDERWPIETLARFLDAIRLAPNVDVQLLTKRIESFDERLRAVLDSAYRQPSESQWSVKRPFHQWLCTWQAQRNGPSNVWLGVSVEDKQRADERIPLLLKTPAAVRFLSVEPLLESVDFGETKGSHDGRGLCWDWTGSPIHVPHCDYAAIGKQPPEGPKIDWVIVGGESGKNRRDCGVEAIISVAKQCVAAGVPVYVKQDCAFKSGQQGRIPDDIWKLKQFP